MKTKVEFKNGSWMQFKNFMAVQSGVALLCLAAASSPAQTYTVLHNFTGSEGAQPEAGLVLSGTTLYGTTYSGGRSNCGTVFKVNTDGSGYEVLKEFTNIPDGANPEGGLVLSGTTLYGTTTMGGCGGINCGDGTVFKINTDGSGYTILIGFNGTYGANPRASLILSGTTLYGTTASGGNNGGNVFKLNTDGTGFTLLRWR